MMEFEQTRESAEDVIISFKDGHDGSAALLIGNKLELLLEVEKDSGFRYGSISADFLINALSKFRRVPTVIAQSGWSKGTDPQGSPIGAGYEGLIRSDALRRTFMGHSALYFSSTHERSHLMCAYGLSPFPQGQPCYALLWEGHFGALYYIDESVKIYKLKDILSSPGDRFSFIYALADPSFNLRPGHIRLSDAGKLMAIAAYGRNQNLEPDAKYIIDRLLDQSLNLRTINKADFASSPFYNIGVTHPRFAALAHHFSNALFEIFKDEVSRLAIKKLPLLISGGCGLNCDWNTLWRDSSIFTDVFIPPCTNDSGSAIGTAIDALHSRTGVAKIVWSVYAGEQAVEDGCEHAGFVRVEYSSRKIAELLNAGGIIGWVNGRYEIGPRALGNRSIIAAPFPHSNLERLNKIKLRENFRPIAPLCLERCMKDYFSPSSASAYMLEFRKVVSTLIPAVTHVDGSARPQSITKEQNEALHDVLEEFYKITDIGVLCNTSLNFNGRGFINRLSDLHIFAVQHGLDAYVFNDQFFVRKGDTLD